MGCLVWKGLVSDDRWLCPSDISPFNDNIRLTPNVDIAIFLCKVQQNTFSSLASCYRIIILFWKIHFDVILKKLDKILFELKNIHMFFITNVMCKHFVSQHKF
jgi:hypothetical protein